MSREILFRGKRLDNGEWLEVDAITQSDGRAFAVVGWDYDANKTPCNFYTIEVDTTTIGQFTGLTDKNGREIFEGDILADGAVVEWFNDLSWEGGGSDHSGFYCKKWFEYGQIGELSYHNVFNDKTEIIGNIHDNPELVK